MNKLENRIKYHRNIIDKIDVKLVKLLNKRALHAKEIGRLKINLGLKVYSPDREREVMENVKRINNGPLSISAVKRLFKCIMIETRKVESIEVMKTKGKYLKKK